MKNLHLSPTLNPSRIYLIKSNNKLGITSNNPEFTENFGSGTQNQNIYITNSEEIKEGDCSFYPPFGVGRNIIINGELCFHIESKDGVGSFTQRTYQTLDLNKKIILTTDSQLIADGVQTIDDEFLQWFVKNPSCESVKTDSYKTIYHTRLYKIIIPKEEPNYNMKQEILDEMKRPNQYSKPLKGVRTESYHPSDCTNNQYADDLNTYIDYLELQLKQDWEGSY